MPGHHDVHQGPRRGHKGPEFQDIDDLHSRGRFKGILQGIIGAGSGVIVDCWEEGGGPWSTPRHNGLGLPPVHDGRRALNALLLSGGYPTNAMANGYSTSAMVSECHAPKMDAEYSASAHILRYPTNATATEYSESLVVSGYPNHLYLHSGEVME